MSLYRSSFWCAVCLFCSLLMMNTGTTIAAEPAKQELILGVFPFLPVSNLESIFAPVAAEISDDLDRPVKLRLTSTYDAFITTVQDEGFDIVHIHPFDYVRYGRPNGYIPLVARSEKLFAQFSVKKGSAIAKISSLKGKRIGTPPRTGAVTYLALDALQKAGLSPEKDLKITNFPNHFSCLQQLQIGNIDACATSSSTLKTFESQFGLQFKRIGQSISISHTLFAAHKRIPLKEREQIRASLLGTPLEQVDPKLRQLFIESANTTTGNYFKAVTDRDYNPARQILKRLGGSLSHH